MTVIAFKDGIIAADTGIWSGDTMVGECSKIVAAEGGYLVAAAGNHAESERFRRWAKTWPLSAKFDKLSKLDPPLQWNGFDIDNEDFGALIVEPNGGVIHINGSGLPSTLKAEFAVEGCAGEMAFYAMLAGASAVEAVALCIAHHAHAGGTVQFMSINTPIAEAA